MELEEIMPSSIPRKNVSFTAFLDFAFLIFGFLANHKINRQSTNIPKPTSRNISGRISITCKQ
jgi:hypothetical protein